MNRDVSRTQLAKAAGDRAPKTEPLHWTQRQARYLRQAADRGRSASPRSLTPRQRRRLRKTTNRALLAQAAEATQ